MKAKPEISEGEKWKVFAVNDSDWWLARTAEEAREDAIAWHIEQSVARDRGEVEDLGMVYELGDVEELSAEDLQRLTYVDDMASPTVRRSFQEELDRRVAARISGPEMFASSEY